MAEKECLSWLQTLSNPRLSIPSSFLDAAFCFIRYLVVYLVKASHVTTVFTTKYQSQRYMLVKNFFTCYAMGIYVTFQTQIRPLKHHDAYTTAGASISGKLIVLVHSTRYWIGEVVVQIVVKLSITLAEFQIFEEESIIHK